MRWILYSFKHFHTLKKSTKLQNESDPTVYANNLRVYLCIKTGELEAFFFDFNLPFFFFYHRGICFSEPDLFPQVGNLDSGRFYQFRVFAANVAGVGKPSEASKDFLCEKWTMPEPGKDTFKSFRMPDVSTYPHMTSEPTKNMSALP